MNFSRYRSFLGALVLLHFAFSAFAKPTLEDYGALPTVQMMSVSPDGTMVAFRRHSAERDIVVVYSLDEGKAITGIEVSEIRPNQLYFLDHSRLIMVASEQRWMSRYGSNNRISSAFALDITTGQVMQLLTPGDNIVNDQLGLGDILGISADGKHVYMPAFIEGRSHRRPDLALMEVDLQSVSLPGTVTRGTPNTVDYFLDDNGHVLAEEIFNNHTDSHRIIAYHDGEEVEIYQQETEIPQIGVAALTADRKSLIFETDSYAEDRVSYYTMALADGAVSGPIFEREDADVEAILKDINRIAYGVVYSGLTPTYEFFDEKLTERLKKIQAQFPRNSIWLTDASPDLHHLVVRVEGSNTSGDYYLFSDVGTNHFLASARPNIPPDSVNPVITYEYKARDGAVIPSLLTVPLAHAENPHNLPAVMLPHGGPESHDWLGFDWLAQALASQGYAVIQPQFRGSSGFGLQHLLAGRGEWGKKSQNDITDALNYLVAEELVDPERVCIAGASYGGFAALAGGAFTPELYKCVVSIAGVSDVRMMLRKERSKYGRDHWALAYWNEVVAKGDGSEETLDSISPANFAHQFTAPVLLVHGEDDKVVDFEQSEYMQEELEDAGKQVELVELEGEDHHLSNPETRLECLERMVAFINEYIGKQEG